MPSSARSRRGRRESPVGAHRFRLPRVDPAGTIRNAFDNRWGESSAGVRVSAGSTPGPDNPVVPWLGTLRSMPTIYLHSGRPRRPLPPGFGLAQGPGALPRSPSARLGAIDLSLHTRHPSSPERQSFGAIVARTRPVQSSLGPKRDGPDRLLQRARQRTKRTLMELKPYMQEQVCDACEELSVRPTYCEDEHAGEILKPHLHYECQRCGYKWSTETAHPITK